jgi:outer membrane protein
MNRYLLLLTLLVVYTTGNAQNEPPATPSRTFTLEQCIAYALENNVSGLNAQIDEKIASARVKETRGIGLPQVDATVGIRHNQKLPRFFAQYAVAQGFAGENEQTGEPNLVIDGAQPTDIVASQNFFQLKSGGDAGLTISQILFNSSYLVGLQAANAYRDLAVKNNDLTKEDIIENVSKAYYSCLINRDRIGLFETNIARVDSVLRTTTALFENGLAESIDVDRIKVTLNNLKVEQGNFLRLQELSIQLLKFQMNYPMGEDIDIQGDLSSVKIDAAVLNEYSSNWDYEQRTDYRLLEANRKLQALNLKNTYAAGLPSLVAYANLGYSTQSPDISGIFKTNSNIPDNGQVGPDKWYPYSTFGVSLNVPLFSGLQRTYRVQQAKLELQKTDNNFRLLKSGIDLEINQSASMYISAVATAESQKQNSELAANIARVTKIKYEQGVGSNLEVVEAESALREAQINYYNALYNAIVAKIDLDRAYGKLIPASANNQNK